MLWKYDFKVLSNRRFEEMYVVANNIKEARYFLDKAHKKGLLHNIVNIVTKPIRKRKVKDNETFLLDYYMRERTHLGKIEEENK